MVTGVVVTAEMLERPQEALFAEAARLLHAVLALTGEGEVPGPALSRSLVATGHRVREALLTRPSPPPRPGRTVDRRPWQCLA